MLDTGITISVSLGFSFPLFLCWPQNEVSSFFGPRQTEAVHVICCPLRSHAAGTAVTFPHSACPCHLSRDPECLALPPPTPTKNDSRRDTSCSSLPLFNLVVLLSASGRDLRVTTCRWSFGITAARKKEEREVSFHVKGSFFLLLPPTHSLLSSNTRMDASRCSFPLSRDSPCEWICSASVCQSVRSSIHCGNACLSV